MDRLYTQGEINTIFEAIPNRTLFSWAQLGLVEWSEESKDRRGTHRRYTLENLWRIGLVEELMALNVGIPFARRVMGFLQNQNTEEHRLDLWKTCSMVLGQSRPGLHKEHLFAQVFPEEFRWQWGLIMANEEVGGFMREHLEDSLVVVTINLRSVMNKVEAYLKQAEV
jgi:hypothetical protein